MKNTWSHTVSSYYSKRKYHEQTIEYQLKNDPTIMSKTKIYPHCQFDSSWLLNDKLNNKNDFVIHLMGCDEETRIKSAVSWLDNH